ncbi:MAG: hypothetical protein A2Y23_01415 [Clostridiales bacterium GWB2_37_7]|nr:MAG: hypothetical protein A2Y23_01415 [Clostridiales bacterium GWB2_37_7]
MQDEHWDERHFTVDEAYKIGKYLGIDFESCGYDVEQYRIGLDVELEHGRIDLHTNVTNDDPILTGKIALAHLNEFPDYYKRLTRMEEKAEKYWDKRKCK